MESLFGTLRFWFGSPRRTVGLVLVLAIGVGFAARQGAQDNFFDIAKNIEIFGNIVREVNLNYVDDVEPNKFARVGIDAMLKSLDPYTNYISASEIEDYRFMSTGQYGGIGAVIEKQGNVVVVREPYKGWPADKAGLRAGDVIIKIGDEMVEGEKFTTLDIRNMLRGQAGTMVRLVVRRPGVNELMTLELKREDIKIDNVRYSTLVHEDIGYVLLRGFTNGAGEEVKKAIQDLKKLNPNLKGLVLDLRDNPGGLLQEAINISSLFVGNQEKIVETRGRMDGSLKSYNASVPPIETQLPLVVLINSNSASASEIVSGVMQDLDRGVVLGTRSFGKGLVQTTVRLSYESQLKITTARYFTPSGRCIQAVDYAQRGEDGSVVRTPDSLQKNFYTRNGRLMHDAGGIEPDEVVEIEALREVTMQLLRENYIFNYATRFRNQHESLADPKTFALTDAQYKDFVTYAIDSGFKFKPLVMREIEELGNKLTKRDYFTSVETSYNDLVGKTQNAVDQDIWTHRTEIQQLLEEEIVSRYFYSEGRTQQQLAADPQLEAAVSLLRDLDRYSTYLKGSK